MNHSEYAQALFYQGYNCSQAVFVAFCDLTEYSPEEAARLSSSFGGGLGRMRETCGAVSGMLLAAGVLYGYAAPGDEEAKAAHYRLVQTLVGRFREEAGTILCRELLGNPSSDPTPTPRTAEFYATRPCARLVGLAAGILEEYLGEEPPWKT